VPHWEHAAEEVVTRYPESYNDISALSCFTE